MHEEEQVRRASSVADRAAYRRSSRISAREAEYAASADTEVEPEVYEDPGKEHVGKEDV
jgi:hypothetical protein